MKRRVLSVLLSLCMVLCFVPSAVFAEDAAGAEPDTAFSAEEPEGEMNKTEGTPEESPVPEPTAEPTETPEGEPTPEPEPNISVQAAAVQTALSGTGAADSPYLIYTADDLKAFRDKVNGGERSACAKQMADIDLNNEKWTPIGWYENESSFCGYTGTFNGDGHTIRGLNVEEVKSAGLFGYAQGTAKIQNLTVSGYVEGLDYAGGIVGRAEYDATSTNLRYPEIKSCINKCDVRVFAGNIVCVGGIAGYGGGSSIMESRNKGRISGSGSEAYVGGIVGRMEDPMFGNIEFCSNEGEVNASGYNTYIGGIAGASDTGCRIIAASNTGKVVSYGVNVSHVGGLVGQTRGITIRDSYNVGEVKAGSGDNGNFAGGIIGENYSYSSLGQSELENCYNAGKVSAEGGNQNCAGGIVGKIGGTATFTNCYWLTDAAENAVGSGSAAQNNVAAKSKYDFANGDVLALLAHAGVWKSGYLDAVKMTLPILSHQDGDPHDHSFERKYNDTEHWQECFCGVICNKAAHQYDWQTKNGQYWQTCAECGKTGEKKDAPTISVVGAENVCRTQDYEFTFTLPEGATDAAYGYEFALIGDGPLTPTFENGLYCGKIKATIYPENEEGFCLVVSGTLADGYSFSVRKAVTIQNAHSGGTATCTEQAVCEVCGESYGELDANNHTDLKHFPLKAATETAEGNIEYWYCSGCGKYYKDAAATQEITKEQTITAKLPSSENNGKNDNKGNDGTAGGKKPSAGTPASPATGDSGSVVLWAALLLVSGGALAGTAACAKKKKN